MIQVKSFGASVKDWTEEALQDAEFIVRATIQDLAELMSVGKDGLVRGAPFEVGVVPVDEGELIASLRVYINEQEIARGTQAGRASAPPDYTAALIGFSIGDDVTVAFTADHARAIEYGFRVGDDDTDDGTGDVDVPGRFMVWTALQSFDELLAANVRDFSS